MLKKDIVELYNSLEFLIYIDKHNYLTKIFKFSKCSYTPLYRRIKFFIKHKVITSEKEGRKRKFYLTEKGELILNHLLTINLIFINSFNEGVNKNGEKNKSE